MCSAHGDVNRGPGLGILTSVEYSLRERPKFTDFSTRRDWSLITAGRGATKWEGGGTSEVLPLRKGGQAEKVIAMLKRGEGGGHNKF